MKTFNIKTILSVTTGIKACQSIYSVLRLLSYLTQDKIYNEPGMMQAAMNEVTPYLREQLPWLRGIKAEDIAGSDCLQKMDQLAKKHGRFHAVRPIHSEDHKHLDLLDQLETSIPAEKILVMPSE